MVKALKRLIENIQNTPYSDDSVEVQEIKDPQNDAILRTPEQVQQTLKRLWDLYQSYCERLKSVETDF